MGKQAISKYHTNFNMQMETMETVIYILYYLRKETLSNNLFYEIYMH